MKTEIKKTPLDDLIGKTVEEVWTADDNEIIRFVLNDNSVLEYRCFGDCCSKSWIEHLSGFWSLIKNEIKKIEENSSRSFDREMFENICIYSFTISTKKGQFDLEMRNESNGYYGGWIQKYRGQDQYGDVEKDAKLKLKWTKIEKDF